MPVDTIEEWFRWTITDRKATVTVLLSTLILATAVSFYALYHAEAGRLSAAIGAVLFAGLSFGVFILYASIAIIQFEPLPDTVSQEYGE